MRSLNKSILLMASGSVAVVVLVVLSSQQLVDASAIHHPSPPSEPYSYHFDPYSFGYDVEDNYGNKQWKQEKSNNPHEVHGSYGYRDKNGIYREVTYVADKNGFRANIKTNEPGVTGTKDPANVHLDSYYSPPPPPAQLMVAALPQSAPVYAPKSQPIYYQRS